MNLGSALGKPIILATLFASTLVASAQAPDPGAAAQEKRDIAGRWLGASDTAVQEFGKAGGTLTNIAVGKFEGVSGAISKADWAASYGALSAGDVRGAVSGAVAIKVGAAATSGGAALFGEIGAVTGGVIGSFFPVVGNVAGTMLGGAVGTAVGGFVTAYSYDKYVKDYVSKGVLAGIASVFDTAPLDQAMQARRAFLLQTMTPDQQAQLQVFKPEEVALIDFGALPYVPMPKQPAPDAQRQAALTTGNVLAGVRKFSIGANDEQVWEIHDGVATFHTVFPGPVTRSEHNARGQVSVNRIEGNMTWLMTTTGKCATVNRDNSPFVFVFTADTVTAEVKPGPVEVLSNPCKAGFAATTRGFNFSAPWKKLE
jgi:hypothetical protein